MIINISGPHNFEKLNLVTQIGRKGSYDTLKCSKCGITGRTKTLTTIDIPNTYSLNKIHNCDGVLPERPTRIKIKACHAFGAVFANLTIGSEHEVISAPKEYEEDHKGVWVMGVGVPVKILNHEFSEIE